MPDTTSYDVDKQPYVYEQDTARDLHGLKHRIRVKLGTATTALAALPPDSKSYKARRYRDYIASAPKRIADLDRLIAIVEASSQA